MVSGGAVISTFRLHTTASSYYRFVIAYHGSHSSGEALANDTDIGLRSLADQKGFILACPNGVGGGWNCLIGAVSGADDDVAFTRAMIDLFCNSYHADPDRVFVAGVSAGGYLVYRLAMESPDKIAAAGVVVGGLGIYSVNGVPVMTDIPKPAAPVSLMHICGLKDPGARYGGFQFPKNKVLPVPTSIGVFVASNRCLAAPKEKYDKKYRIRRVRYGECDAGTEVELVVFEKLGHVWPVASNGLSASQTLWEFFSTHPKLR